METGQSSKQIIIIGAGIAGLAAYHHLRQNGLNVMILEARHRAGGRVHTEYRLGTPVNAGAAWIHGSEGNPITQLAKKTHSAIAVSDYKKIY